MYVENLGEIKAVAFDIDGTLYKDWHLFRRMTFHFLRYSLFFLEYGLVRTSLRKGDAVDDFPKAQAEKMANYLKCSPEEAAEKLDRIVYSGLKHYFDKIKPCNYSYETIKEFKNAGLKIALLSDFPPEQKGELWGLKPYCDVLLGTEECGALKPSPVPFKILADKLGVKTEEILYVGNNLKFDVLGSKRVGMKSAWFVSPAKYFWQKKNKSADFVFCDYRKLKDAVLK